MTEYYNQKWSRDRRRALRSNMTKAELLLWQQIRRSQLGVRFKRQFGIGPYIADFYATKVRLVIEVDGDSHCTPSGEALDADRDAYMRGLGICVLRVTNLEVYEDMEGVLKRISALLNDLPLPLLRKEGDC